MAADPLDFAELMQEAGTATWNGMPSGTDMGHLHLHVGDLDAAKGFYSDALGFDRTVWGYPGALFLAAGGYHHHLGTNLWAGDDAVRPPSGDAQLLEWNIRLPDASSVEAAARSLTDAGHQVESGDTSASDPVIVARDPWGTAVRLSA